jgi:hypothetical protein
MIVACSARMRVGDAGLEQKSTPTANYSLAITSQRVPVDSMRPCSKPIYSTSVVAMLLHPYYAEP